jgi:hypothetical protein
MQGNVTALVPHVEAPRTDDEMRLRRLAVQIATQLPESAAEAHRVLVLVDELVGSFLAPRGS